MFGVQLGLKMPEQDKTRRRIFEGTVLGCIKETIPSDVVNRTQLDEICLFAHSNLRSSLMKSFPDEQAAKAKRPAARPARVPSERCFVDILSEPLLESIAQPATQLRTLPTFLTDTRTASYD